MAMSMQLEDTEMETLKFEEDLPIDEYSDNLDMRVLESVQNTNEYIEEDVVKLAALLLKDNKLVHPRNNMDKKIIKPVMDMDKQNIVDEANVPVSQNNLNKITPKKFNSVKVLPTVTKQSVPKPLVPLTMKIMKKVVPKSQKSTVKCSVKSPVESPMKSPVLNQASPVLAVVPNILSKKNNPKLPPLQILEEDFTVEDKPNELTLLWSRAETTELSEVNNNSEINYCDSDGGFMTYVNDALLSIPYDGKPFVYKIQVCYVQLEIRYPAVPMSYNSLPSVAHYITLNPYNFLNTMEVARYIAMETKEQIMTCDYSGAYDAEHLNRIVGIQPAGFSYKKLFSFILRTLFVALHLSIIGLGILIVVAYFFLHCYDREPITNWVQFLLRVKDFIQKCLRCLENYMKLVYY